MNPNIFIAVPCFGCYCCKEFLSALLMLRVACAKAGIGTTVKLLGNESLITRARNVLTAEFLASREHTHLLFIDSDINFSAQSVMDMLTFDKELVCGIYAKKSFDFNRLEQLGKTIEPIQQLLLSFNINVVKETPVIENRFIKALDGATGFMLIQRGAIERMYEAYKEELSCVNDIPNSREAIPRYVAIFETMIDTDRRYLSEDYAFVRRFQRIGGEIWVDLNAVLGHVGNYTFTAANKHVVPGAESLIQKKLTKNEVQAAAV